LTRGRLRLLRCARLGLVRWRCIGSPSGSPACGVLRISSCPGRLLPSLAPSRRPCLSAGRRLRRLLLTAVLALTIGIHLLLVRRLTRWTAARSSCLLPRWLLLLRVGALGAWPLRSAWPLRLRSVALGLILGARSPGVLLHSLTGVWPWLLTVLDGRLNATRRTWTFRSLGGWLLRVACTHLSSSWTPGPSVTRVGSRVTLLLPTRARNSPQPRSNWNHHPQQCRLQVVLLLQLSQD
jgi:hypothetical protein